jgi:hypothetical protein
LGIAKRESRSTAFVLPPYRLQAHGAPQNSDGGRPWEHIAGFAVPCNNFGNPKYKDTGNDNG